MNTVFASLGLLTLIGGLWLMADTFLRCRAPINMLIGALGFGIGGSTAMIFAFVL